MALSMGLTFLINIIFTPEATVVSYCYVYIAVKTASDVTTKTAKFFIAII